MCLIAKTKGRRPVFFRGLKPFHRRNPPSVILIILFICAQPDGHGWTTTGFLDLCLPPCVLSTTRYGFPRECLCWTPASRELWNVGHLAYRCRPR